METKKINFMDDIKLVSTEKIKPHVKYSMIQPPFTAGFVGTCNSGKTYSSIKLIIELIKENALKSQDIYIISPSFYQNNMFHNIPNLKKQNILTKINDVFDFVAKLTKETSFINKVWKTTKKKYTRQQYIEWYKNIIDKLADDDNDDDDEYPRASDDIVLSDDLTNVEYLHLKLNGCEKTPYFYDYVPSFLLFIDDASHSKIYANTPKNPFLNFFLRYRHYNCSIICATQTYKSGIPRALRLNISCWCIWAQGEEDMKKIYDEVISTTVRKRNVFYELFEKITNGDHDFMMIDKEAKKEHRIRKNFNEFVIFNSIDNINHGNTKTNEKPRVTNDEIQNNKKEEEQENNDKKTK